jgi:hypothetical protein
MTAARRHVAYIATNPAGEMALAIAHQVPDVRAVLDTVKTTVVAGGDAGIDAVYRGLREQGIEVDDWRDRRRPGERNSGPVTELAIAGALKKAVEQ